MPKLKNPAFDVEYLNSKALKAYLKPLEREVKDLSKRVAKLEKVALKAKAKKA